MIIQHSEISTLDANFNIEQKSFGIRTTEVGHLISILRDKMYEDPLKAFIRELACNSRDANREKSGNGDGIIISLVKDPDNGGSPHISFTDQGPGISEERIEDVFLNYGASTKTSSNLETGGFGLGAKSPFAYSDSFTIQTTVDGYRYLYLASLSGSTTGSLSLLNKEECFEYTGTTISVPIKPEDLHIAKDICLRLLSGWDEEASLEVDGDVVTIPSYFNGYLFRSDKFNGVMPDSMDEFTFFVDGLRYSFKSEKLVPLIGPMPLILPPIRLSVGDIELLPSRDRAVLSSKNYKTVAKAYKAACVKFVKDHFDKVCQKEGSLLRGFIRVGLKSNLGILASSLYPDHYAKLCRLSKLGFKYNTSAGYSNAEEVYNITTPTKVEAGKLVLWDSGRASARSSIRQYVVLTERIRGSVTAKPLDGEDIKAFKELFKGEEIELVSEIKTDASIRKHYKCPAPVKASKDTVDTYSAYKVELNQFGNITVSKRHKYPISTLASGVCFYGLDYAYELKKDYGIIYRNLRFRFLTRQLTIYEDGSDHGSCDDRTIYVLTNSAVQKITAKGELPSLKTYLDINKLEDLVPFNKTVAAVILKSKISLGVISALTHSSVFTEEERQVIDEASKIRIKDKVRDTPHNYFSTRYDSVNSNLVESILAKISENYFLATAFYTRSDGAEALKDYIIATEKRGPHED